MNPANFPPVATPAVLAASIVASLPAQALDVNDQLSVAGVLALSGQCQSVSALLSSETYGEELRDDAGEPLLADAADPLSDDTMDPFDDDCKGGMPFRLEVSYHPSDYNELFFKLGFAAGNGLNEVSPWNLAPWGADLEDDVKDINGRNRDYLLTAWYKYTQVFHEESSLGASIGLVDTTDYIDDNEYANDAYTQFMNEVFVNSGTYGLPSYDAGAALEYENGRWSLTGIGMNIGENDDGNSFNFWGAQTAYQADTPLGTGNYRIILAGTSSAFLDPAETKNERRFAGGISFDQELGDLVGGFLRFTWQQEDAAVDYKALYSGGLNFSGGGWNRDEDNIGAGYAYLDGGNLSIESSQVFEAYYRAGLNDYAAITADVQYMNDDVAKDDPRENNPSGWIFSIRLAAEF